MPEHPAAAFADPIWNALQTSHRHLALTAGQPAGLACKYPAEVAPFAAVAEQTPQAFADLHSLLLPGETTYVAGPLPRAVPGLSYGGVLPCLQMHFPADAPLPANADKSFIIEDLYETHAAEMVALTDVAFPGLFRIRTCAMGHYFGLRDAAGRLIAMGGERFILDPIREISALCTHPDHRGRGHAVRLLGHLLALHRGEGSVSCLHVVATNTNAIHLYRRLGFQTLREVNLHRLTRAS